MTYCTLGYIRRFMIFCVKFSFVMSWIFCCFKGANFVLYIVYKKWLTNSQVLEFIVGKTHENTPQIVPVVHKCFWEEGMPLILCACRDVTGHFNVANASILQTYWSWRLKMINVCLQNSPIITVCFKWQNKNFCHHEICKQYKCWQNH